MKIRPELALLTTALTLGVAEAAQADTLTLTQGPIIEQVVPAPAQQQVDFCINEAFGAKDNVDLLTSSANRAVGSKYVGESTVRFAFLNNANAVSTDCTSIIASRVTTARQIYKGRLNSPTVSFTGLGAADNERREVKLRKAFTAIPGPGTRGYVQEVATTVTLKNGLILRKAGKLTVRGQSDEAGKCPDHLLARAA